MSLSKCLCYTSIECRFLFSFVRFETAPKIFLLSTLVQGAQRNLVAVAASEEHCVTYTFSSLEDCLCMFCFIMLVFFSCCSAICPEAVPSGLQLKKKIKKFCITVQTGRVALKGQQNKPFVPSVTVES